MSLTKSETAVADMEGLSVLLKVHHEVNMEHIRVHGRAWVPKYNTFLAWREQSNGGHVENDPQWAICLW